MMTAPVDYNLAELTRRLSNLIRVGTIAEVDYAKALARVQTGELVSNWCPWLTSRAGGNRSWDAPEVGEQVVLLSPDGNPGQGIILPALYQNSAPAPVHSEALTRYEFGDGAAFEYDRDNNRLTIKLPEGANVSVRASGGLSFEGDLKVDGDVADSSGPLSRLRANYNAHTHIGNLGSPTPPPAEQDGGPDA